MVPTVSLCEHGVQKRVKRTHNYVSQWYCTASVWRAYYSAELYFVIEANEANVKKYMDEIQPSVTTWFQKQLRAQNQYCYCKSNT